MIQHKILILLAETSLIMSDAIQKLTLKKPLPLVCLNVKLNTVQKDNKKCSTKQG
jgi:hypothetical protein